MDKKKHLILLILLILEITPFLFPYIPSQVRGVVRDKETNEVIENTTVYLYEYNIQIKFPDLSKETKTDNKGLFVIDDVMKGKYFITCIKEGYATFSPDYFTQTTEVEKYITPFFIEEGQTKFFEIKMEKGGKLKVTINRKDESGISAFKGVDISLYAVVKKEISERNDYCTIIHYFPTNDLGQLIEDGLHPGQTYGISVKKEEFPDFKKEFLINRDETIEINHIYDYTDQTGIKGSISFSNKPLLYAGIWLVNFSKMKSVSDLDIHHRSEYNFRSLEPGNYMMYIYVTYFDEKGTKIEVPVVVEKNKTTITYLNL